MAEQATSLSSFRAETSPDLGAYIMGIYRGYVESSAALSEYMLYTKANGRGTTFPIVFRAFYSDFFRLYSVTRDLNVLKGAECKTKIDSWFNESRQILDNLKSDRMKVFDYANEGITLAREWVSQLYNKQIIRTVK